MIKKAAGTNNKTISFKIAGKVATLSIDQKKEIAIQINNTIGNNKVLLNVILSFLLKNKTEKMKIAVVIEFIAKSVGKVISSKKKGINDLFNFCSCRISCQAFAKKL